MDDIRSGLAALLRQAMPANEGQVSSFWLDSPPDPCLMVAGVDPGGIEPLGYSAPGGTSKRWTIVIEACLGLVSEVGAQKILNGLLSSDSIELAVESDTSALGALFSRFNDETGVVTLAAAAAKQVAYSGYRGQFPLFLDDGRKMLLARWAVEVIT